ncbi:MAG TPA: hypothetical protein VHY37_04080 [Tepidisphaeraceae bacterium]|nr:hypothetical protein [Tepidisphaeraceae bacterium]
MGTPNHVWRGYCRWCGYSLFLLVAAVLLITRARAAVAQGSSSQPAMSPEEKAKIEDISSLAYSFGGKRLDIFLSADEVAKGRPALADVKWNGVDDVMDGEEYIRFASEPNKHWAVNPKSIVAIQVTDKK